MKNKWRLPTIDELSLMFNKEMGEPRISGFGQQIYWSSTPHAYRRNFAWIVYFGSGYTDFYNKSTPFYVRCVRRAKNGKLEWSGQSKTEMTWDEANEYCKEMNGKANTN